MTILQDDNERQMPMTDDELGHAVLRDAAAHLGRRFDDIGFKGVDLDNNNITVGQFLLAVIFPLSDYLFGQRKYAEVQERVIAGELDQEDCHNILRDHIGETILALAGHNQKVEGHA